jgi:hypothetical protein
MKHQTSTYKVSNYNPSRYFRQFTDNQIVEVWADIIKPSEEPKVTGEWDYKLAKVLTTVPIEPHRLQRKIDKAAPGYKLLTWWIPETEEPF